LLSTIALELNKLAITLDQGKDNQAQSTTIGLEKFTAKLPQLKFSQQQQTQLTFDQLNVAGQQFQIQHGEQTLLKVPSIALQNIALDLAKQQANIAQIQLSQGAITAKRSLDGRVDWQTAFAPSSKVADAPEVTAKEATPTEPKVTNTETQAILSL